jgi:ankyrin repeat protein
LADALRSAPAKPETDYRRKPELSSYQFACCRRLAVLACVSLGLAFASFGALANQKVCRSLDQRHEQIERGASSIEVNAMLFSAADKGCKELAQRLLDNGASLEARDRLGVRPLGRAAAAGQPELVALFLDRGAPIDARAIDGSTAVYQAAEAGRLPIVQQLVEHGANITLPGRSGLTPLEAGAYMGSQPIVELLIDKGADPKAADNTQKTAIIYAAGKGFPDIVRLLLDHGVDVNARYGNDLTVLMWAAGYSDEAGVNDMEKVITLLLDRGAHIDDQDNRGRTPLMIAAELNHAGAVDLLLARGADKGLRDKQGKSAADLTSLTVIREKLAATQ